MPAFKPSAEMNARCSPIQGVCVRSASQSIAFNVASSGGTKPAVVETGATIKVPLYLEVGTVIKIDTRTRAYVERVR